MFMSRLARLAGLLPLMALCLFGCAAPALTGAANDAPLALKSQGSFFVGGRDLTSEDLSSLPVISPKGTVTVDQVYVRYQIPATQHMGPALTFIHGCCLTGKTWETTPDGRMGWDEFFLRRGHPVYVIDQAWRGRSAANPAGVNAVKAGRRAADTLPVYVVPGHETAWQMFRFGPDHPIAFSGMQFPLESQGEFWKQMVPDWSYSLAGTNPTVPALAELAGKIGGTVLVSHSQSGIYPFQAAAIDARNVQGIVAVEPSACPAPQADMRPYRGLPTLIVFGDYVAHAPYWAARLKSCRDFMQAANAAGGRVEVQVLPDLGIQGNTHMLMQDRNSLQVAQWLEEWLAQRIATRD